EKPAPPQAEQKEKSQARPQKTQPDKDKKPQDKQAAQAQTSSMPDSLRVNVGLLENLMNLAGELVLSRNQLMQAISTQDDQTINLAGQRIDLVTSELQEAIMLTRMQPVSNVFNKFPRVVRDMSQSLGKDIELYLEGKEVELDKTIIEGLSDPLTHLVRNSADHAIEKPDERVAKGKKPQGKIVLKAFHAAGQVNIEIIDDGKGIPVERIVEKALDKGLITEEQVRTMSDKDKAQLIFLPGLSTADQITDVSGRGVGMDVVKSNLDRLGGQVDIDTEEGKGTSIRIKLPLTLAIIPSLLISVSQERFAIPQINVDELIQIPAQQVQEKIEVVGDAQVLILRGELIPLVGLNEILRLDQKNTRSKARVTSIEEARSRKDRQDKKAETSAQTSEKSRSEDAGLEKEVIEASKWSISGEEDINIVVVYSGTFKYGLVVDELHDSVEIVVKPLGRHLKACDGYAGATIMGDGHVALILDVVGMARLAELSSMAGTEKAQEMAREQETEKEKDLHSLFLFNNGPREHCAVPLDLVARVELIKAEDIEITGGKKVIQYRGGVLPVFALHEAASVEHLELEGELVVIVFYMAGHEVGLLASPPVDAREVRVEIDDFTLKQNGISGSAVLEGYTTLIVDIYEFMETLNPQWFESREKVQSLEQEGGTQILLVEDSDFFRNQVKKFIQDEGYEVVAAEDGAVAWQYMQDNPGEVQLVVTDLEMPNMDGFELTEHIKSDDRFNHLPVLALTSLAGEEDVARGKKVGIDDYQIKLDKEKLLQSIF
ncbi:chemotaxis protein CheW, partial [Desulfonatronospira sp. MSAO_Bac3]